jgi:hypothetical protein
MADGIRINDAALEISPAGLEALVNRQGAAVTLTRIDLSVSPEALSTLLARFAPEGEPPPTAELSEGRLQVSATREGKPMTLDLQVGGLRLEISTTGLRLVSGSQPEG